MIERDQQIVTLYQGKYGTQLSALWDEFLKLMVTEASEPKRQSTRSKAAAKAKEHDQLQTEAEAAAIKVPIWGASYREWRQLAHLHPPRKGDTRDAQQGMDRSEFPMALLKIGLVEPGTADGFDDLVAKGDAALDALGELTQPQYVKLETAAWNLSAGDDEIPFRSALSLLKQQRDHDSAPQPDSE